MLIVSTWSLAPCCTREIGNLILTLRRPPRLLRARGHGKLRLCMSSLLMQSVVFCQSIVERPDCEEQELSLAAHREQLKTEHADRKSWQGGEGGGEGSREEQGGRRRGGGRGGSGGERGGGGGSHAVPGAGTGKVRGQTSRKERAGAESCSTQRTAKNRTCRHQKTGKRGSNGRARRVYCKLARGGKEEGREAERSIPDENLPNDCHRHELNCGTMSCI